MRKSESVATLSVDPGWVACVNVCGRVLARERARARLQPHRHSFRVRPFSVKRIVVAVRHQFKYGRGSAATHTYTHYTLLLIACARVPTGLHIHPPVDLSAALRASSLHFFFVGLVSFGGVCAFIYTSVYRRMRSENIYTQPVHNIFRAKRLQAHVWSACGKPGANISPHSSVRFEAERVSAQRIHKRTPPHSVPFSSILWTDL